MIDLSSFLTATVALTGATALVFVDAEAGPLPAPRSDLGVTGKHSAMLVDLETDGRLYVPIVANGRNIAFMVDTGASHTLIDPLLAQSLSVRIDGTTQLQTVGGVIDAATGQIASLTAGSITIRDMRVIVVDGLARPVLGMDILSQTSGLEIQSVG